MYLMGHMVYVLHQCSIQCHMHLRMVTNVHKHTLYTRDIQSNLTMASPAHHLGWNNNIFLQCFGIFDYEGVTPIIILIY